MLKKVLGGLLIIFIVLFCFTIPKINNNTVLKTSIEISDVSHLKTNKVYLLNKDNLLVSSDIFLDSDSLVEKVENIIKYLEVDNNEKSDLVGYLPKGSKVLSVRKNMDILEIDLNKSVIEGEVDLNIIRTGLVYSLLSIDNVNKISISIDGQYIKGFTKELTKDIGINSEYLLNTRYNVDKVVIYYLDDTFNYYIPVTKYLNDKREKIEIVIEELRNNYNKDYISLLDYNTKLINYRIDEDVLFLNFNSNILNDSIDVQDKIYKMISYAAFDNYDVGMVMFEVDGQALKQIKKNSI